MSTKKKLLEAAAGNAGGEAVYVDDVFSTYLYDGTGATQTITNGIDLAGEGGLTWIKARNIGTSGWHSLSDTERGAGYIIRSDLNSAQSFDTAEFTSFNSDGFTVGNDTQTNGSGNTYASWTFRKAPGFFDVVTYTGDGVAGRTVAHNLGSVPGMIIVKSTSNISDWYVYHASEGPTKYLRLNTTDSASTGAGAWSNTAPTTSEFTVQSVTNYSGQDYVAYLFAHDAQDFGTDEDESIIKCGSYTGNGSTDGPEIDLGWEPQWILIKGASSGATYDWKLYDTMRGLPTGQGDQPLQPNKIDAEENNQNNVDVTATGFKLTNGSLAINKSGETYIYMAIRRPHKPAEEFAATDLFSPNATASATGTEVSTNFPIDMQIINLRSVVDFRNGSVNDRLRGVSSTSTETANYLITNSTSAESTSGSNQTRYWDNTGFQIPSFISTNSTIFWNFRRAPGFFDVVAYTGDGTSGRAISHNLRVVPEMIWLKNRSDAGSGANWTVALSTTAPSEGALNNNNGFAAYGNVTAFATSTFTLLNGAQEINQSSKNYIAYLFATVAGISKVGSYTGTGSDVDVDCGFTSGARFVLIKRSDSTGDWYVWDSVRGIVAGNDPYLFLNSTAAEVTSTDYIDPLSSGFTITSSAPAALNASGGNYIFLAIA